MHITPTPQVNVTKPFALEGEVRLMSVLGGAGGSPRASGVVAINHSAPVEGPTMTVSSAAGVCNARMHFCDLTQ